MRCFDAARKKDFWIDSQDGAEVEGGFLREVLRVLGPSAPLPSSPRLAPRICIESSADVLCVTESQDLEAAPARRPQRSDVRGASVRSSGWSEAVLGLLW